MRLSRVLTGALALIALEVAVSSNQAAGRVGGMFGSVAGIVRHLLDPTVPLIPDLSGGASPDGAASSAVYQDPSAKGLDGSGGGSGSTVDPTAPPTMSV